MMARIVTFGEVMLRLKPPGSERFFQSPVLEATFGGGEANVAVALARFGCEVSYASFIPENPVGDACVAELRKHGIDVSGVVRKGSRLGIYFLEAGANQRPSVVVYDRAGSAIAEAKAGEIDWDAQFDGAGWFHISGITPAISLSASELALESVRNARSKGLRISCDLNYRKNLWKYGKTAPEVMSEIVRHVHVLIANEEDCQKALGLAVSAHVETGVVDPRQYRAVSEDVMTRYPNLTHVAITLRESRSADENGWSAVLRTKNDFLVSRKYEIRDIVDRVGTGDSFAAGLIYGLITFENAGESLEFATAASCLKHSIPGDLPLLSVPEVRALLRGAGTGRVQR
jgi:2-dehydro-3-deoxygluconokinase